jgi:hypothetical protein
VSTTDKLASAAHARDTHQRNAAHRAVDDPAKLAAAARIVRAALARKRLALTDLTPLPDTRRKSAAGTP